MGNMFYRPVNDKVRKLLEKRQPTGKLKVTAKSSWSGKMKDKEKAISKGIVRIWGDVLTETGTNWKKSGDVLTNQLLLSTHPKDVERFRGHLQRASLSVKSGKIGTWSQNVNVGAGFAAAVIGDPSALLAPGQSAFGQTVTSGIMTSQLAGLKAKKYAIPAITRATFRLDGDKGLLRKAEIDMIVGSLKQINELDKQLFTPLGKHVKIQYGGHAGYSPKEDWVIYDWSWRYIDKRIIEVKIKMVGPGTLATGVKMDSPIAGLKAGKYFTYDWEGTNEGRGVQTIAEVLDYDMQAAMGADLDTDSSALDFVEHRKPVVFPIEGVNGSSSVKTSLKEWPARLHGGHGGEEKASLLNATPDGLDGGGYTNSMHHHHVNNPFPYAGFAVAYRMDNIPDFNDTNKKAGMEITNDSIEYYYSLGYIVHRLINYWILYRSNNCKIAGKIKDMIYQIYATASPRKFMISTDPRNVLITSPAADNFQCTFGRYYVVGTGMKEPDDGDSGVTKFDRSNGKDFRLLPTRENAAWAGSENIDSTTLTTYGSGPGYGNKLWCENILLSRTYLRSIMVDIENIGVDAGSGITRYTAFDIPRFLNKIFAKIKDVTAGYITLQLMKMDKIKIGTKADQFWIVNGNEPIYDEHIKPHVFKLASHDGNVIKQDLQMKVPKALAAEAWARSGAEDGAIGGTGKYTQYTTETDANIGPTAEELKEYANELFQIRMKLFENGFDTTTATAAAGALSGLYNSGLTSKEKAEQEAMPYPLQLTLTLQGIHGFKFGDYISTDFLPARYQNINGFTTAFTVLQVANEFEASGVWVTQVKTVCRLKSNNIGTVTITDEITKPAKTGISAMMSELKRDALDEWKKTLKEIGTGLETI